jgi:hypothetical protein
MAARRFPVEAGHVLAFGAAVAELSVSTVNQDGTEVVAGYATARLDT